MAGTLPWRARHSAAPCLIIVRAPQVTPIFRPLPDTPKARTRHPKVDWRDVIVHYRPVP
jgi:hypothetical protein